MNCKAGGRIRLDANSGSSGFGLNPLRRLGRSVSIPCAGRCVRRIQAAEWSPTPSPRCSVNSGQLRGTHSEKLPFLVFEIAAF